ncbi:MAG: DUF2156 domain-containing protein [Fretibacterium sp.]|nr:DUF2156 domain-containing protein [Fretibacterium sp.]
MLSFAPLAWSDRERYTELYRVCPVRSAEYSFFSLWGWLDSNPMDLAWSNGLCWLRSRGQKSGLCSPVGDWNSVNWEAVLPQHFAPGDVLLDIPEELALLLQSASGLSLNVLEERDEWEYLYPVSELMALKGSKYANKRAHVKAFLSNYSWEYLPLLPEDFPELLEFQEEWCKRHECQGILALEAEDKAVRRALERWDDFPFAGALLRVDGRTIGYTIAEQLDEQTLDIRFEKALSEYAGSYQALNQLFLQRQGFRYLIVNREEDMGNPGLRNAKKSYHPIGFVKKYRVEVLGFQAR